MVVDRNQQPRSTAKETTEKGWMDTHDMGCWESPKGPVIFSPFYPGFLHMPQLDQPKVKS